MKIRKIIFLIIAVLLVILGVTVKKTYLKKDEENNVNTVVAPEELEDKEIKVVTELEKIDIRKYIESIYGSYIAIQDFADINNADETWLWENVRSNIISDEKTSYTYKELEEKTNELYGPNLTKTFPKDGSDFFIFNEDTNAYLVADFTLDWKEWFAIRQIREVDNLYYVEILEFKEDFTGDDNKIKLQNKKGEVLNEFEQPENNAEKTLKELEIQEYVLKNEKKFSKKEIVLEKDEKENLLYVKACVSK